MRKLIFGILISLFFVYTVNAKNKDADSIIVKDLLEKASYEISTNPEASLENAFNAYQLAQKAGYETGQMNALKQLGVLFYEYKVYSKAIKYFEELATVEQPSIQYEAYNELAKIYLKQEDYPNALKYYFKKLDHCKTLDDTLCLAIEYFNIGFCFYKRLDMEEAIKYLNTGIRLFQNLGQNTFLALSYEALGGIFFEKHNYPLSREFYFKSLYQYQELNATYGEAKQCIEISNIYLAEENHEKAVEYANYALNFGQELNLPEIQLKALNILSKSYYALEKYKESIKYQFEYDNIMDDVELLKNKQYEQDSKVQQELIAKSNALEISYAYEQKLDQTNKKYDKAVMILIVLGFSLSFLSIVIGILYINKKARCNAVLKRKNKEIQGYKLEVEHMNSTRNKFFNIISHDLKNPFNALLGFSSLMVNDYDDFNDLEKKKYIRQIYEATESITKLLNNLLEWGKSQSGNIKVNQEEINLAKIVGNVLPIITPQAKNKNIFIKSNIEPNAQAFADANMVSTIIRNLITNAVKFTPENGEISMDTQYNGKYVEIRVKDNGIGIPAKYHESLFTGVNGFRPKLKSDQGTGLGLMLCKEFVLKNGGQIWVESEEGKGSTFKFTLPTVAPVLE